MLGLFREELEVHLPALDEGLLALEKVPDQPKLFEAMMRAAHSIKGAAKIVGVETAVRVAHVMEDCFVAAQNGELSFSSDAIDVLLRGLDILRHLAPGEPNDGIPPADVNRVVAGLEEVRTGKVAARPAAAPPAPPPPAPAPAAAAKPASASKSRPRKPRAKSKAAPAPQPEPEAEPPPPPQPSGPPTIRPAGDLDETAAAALRGQLSTLLSSGAREIRFDLANVNEVDPIGLALLVRTARAAAANRPPIALTIANAAPQLHTLLRLTRLDRSYQTVGPGN
jgi:anti-anti-sigma factor